MITSRSLAAFAGCTLIADVRIGGPSQGCARCGRLQVFGLQPAADS